MSTVKLSPPRGESDTMRGVWFGLVFSLACWAWIAAFVLLVAT